MHFSANNFTLSADRDIFLPKRQGQGSGTEIPAVLKKKKNSLTHFLAVFCIHLYWHSWWCQQYKLTGWYSIIDKLQHYVIYIFNILLNSKSTGIHSFQDRVIWSKQYSDCNNASFWVIVTFKYFGQNQLVECWCISTKSTIYNIAFSVNEIIIIATVIIIIQRPQNIFSCQWN